MTALAIDTVPAFPLGFPTDGTLRYGMTPEQAILYRWLVKHKPHSEAFQINSRIIGSLFLTSHSLIHSRISALVERGWLKKDGSKYAFVQPIKHYRGRRNAA